MSTVLPTILNCARGTLELSTGGGPALAPLGGGPDGCEATEITLVWDIEVTQVYGGSARLTSSMMWGQTKRLSSNDLIRLTWLTTESRCDCALRCSRMTPE